VFLVYKTHSTYINIPIHTRCKYAGSGKLTCHRALQSVFFSPFKAVGPTLVGTFPVFNPTSRSHTDERSLPKSIRKQQHLLFLSNAQRNVLVQRPETCPPTHSALRVACLWARGDNVLCLRLHSSLGKLSSRAGLISVGTRIQSCNGLIPTLHNNDRCAFLGNNLSWIHVATRALEVLKIVLD